MEDNVQEIKQIASLYITMYSLKENKFWHLAKTCGSISAELFKDL